MRLDTRTDGTAVVRLVAIDACAQGQGYGRELMRCVEVLAKTIGVSELLVHAYPNAVGFYEKVGHTHFTFAEAGAHGVQMRKRV